MTTTEGGGPFPGSHRAELHLHGRSWAVAGSGGVVIYHITVFCEELGVAGGDDPPAGVRP